MELISHLYIFGWEPTKGAPTEIISEIIRAEYAPNDYHPDAMFICKWLHLEVSYEAPINWSNLHIKAGWPLWALRPVAQYELESIILTEFEGNRFKRKSCGELGGSSFRSVCQQQSVHVPPIGAENTIFTFAFHFPLYYHIFRKKFRVK